MTLKTLVEHLNQGNFRASDIENINDLVSVYQGKTLIEHVAQYYNNYEVQQLHYAQIINQCFEKFVDLIIPKLEGGLGSPYLKDLQMQYIIFLSYLARRETTVEIKSIESNPKGVFSWYKTLREKLTPAQKKQFDSVDFSKILREMTLINRIVAIAKGCSKVTDLEDKKKEIEDLAQDSLFATHRHYSGWSLNLATQALRSVNIAVPEYSTQTSSNLNKVSKSLDSGGEVYYVKLVAFIMKFYKAFECNFQDDIVNFLETMIGVSIDKPEYRRNLNKVMLEHFTSGEIGREDKVPLLARLKPETNLLLLEFLIKEQGGADYSRFEKNYLTPLKNEQQGLQFDFKLTGSDRHIEILLLMILAVGRFDKIKWFNVSLNQEDSFIDLMKLRRFVGNPKVVLYNSEQTSLDFVEAFRYVFLYSPYPPICYLAFNTIEHKIGKLVEVCKTHGFPLLKLLSNQLHPRAVESTLNYLSTLKISDPAFKLYHRIELSDGRTFDFILTSQGTSPGPLSSQHNTEAKKLFDQYFPPKHTAPLVPLLHQAQFVEVENGSSSTTTSTELQLKFSA